MLRDRLKEKGVTRKILDQLMDADGDGVLTLEEFQYALRKVGVDLEPANFQALLLQCDTNLDGETTCAEALDRLCAPFEIEWLRMQLQANNVSCERLRQLLDANADGVVEFAEWQHALQQVGVQFESAELRALLHLCDTDMDGAVSSAEALSVLYGHSSFDWLRDQLKRKGKTRVSLSRLLGTDRKGGTTMSFEAWQHALAECGVDIGSWEFSALLVHMDTNHDGSTSGEEALDALFGLAFTMGGFVPRHSRPHSDEKGWAVACADARARWSPELELIVKSSVVRATLQVVAAEVAHLAPQPAAERTVQAAVQAALGVASAVAHGHPQGAGGVHLRAVGRWADMLRAAAAAEAGDGLSRRIANDRARRWWPAHHVADDARAACLRWRVRCV